MTASERCVLITKWCGEAWSNLDKDAIVRGFKECGLSTKLDGSENSLVNIEKIPDYTMPEDGFDADEFELDSDEEEEEQDYQENASQNEGENSRIDIQNEGESSDTND